MIYSRFVCRLFLTTCVLFVSIMGYNTAVAKKIDTTLTINSHSYEAMLEKSVYHLNDTVVNDLKYYRRAIIVDARIDEFWEYIVQPDEIMKFLPQIKKYELLSDDEDSLSYFCKAKPYWFIKTHSCTLSVKITPQDNIHWTRTGGDFNYLDCEMKFRTYDEDKTAVLFDVAFDLGGMIPGFIVGWGTKKKLPDFMRYLRDWLMEKCVEGNVVDTTEK